MGLSASHLERLAFALTQPLSPSAGASDPPRPLRLGDPVPWFAARSLEGASIDLHVDAGGWIVLAFINMLRRFASC